MPTKKSLEERGYRNLALKADVARALDAYCAKHSLTKSDAVSLLLGAPEPPSVVYHTPEQVYHTPKPPQSPVYHTPAATWGALEAVLRADMCAGAYVERIKGYWERAVQ